MIDTIPFIVSLPEDATNLEVKGFFSRDEEAGVCDIPTERLKENLSKVCQGVASALDDIKKVGGFSLKQVTIQVEVNAEGGVELIGTAKLGGKGAITLTFEE